MAIYRHILIPTDGSRESEEAAEAGIRLGKALGSRLTAVHVVPDAPRSGLEAWAHSDADFNRRVQESFEQRALLVLEEIREIAYRAGIACECVMIRGGTPHEEILKAALEHECDLIVMASHRIGASTELMLDGETIKVLARGPVPVLVYQ